MSKKIKLNDYFYLTIESVNDKNFSVIGFETVFENDYVLFLGDSQIEFPKTLTYEDIHSLKFVSLNSSTNELGKISPCSRKDLINVIDDKIYNLTANSAYSKESVFDPVNELITNFFADSPLFYKFYFYGKIASDFSIYDNFDNQITDYKIVTYGFKNYIYFCPNNFSTFYFINNSQKEYFEYFKAFELKKFSELFNNKYLEFDEPEYITFFYLYSNENINKQIVTITFEDDTVQKIDCNNNSFNSFLYKDFVIPLFKKVKSFEISNLEQKVFLTYIQETNYFLKEDKYYFQKQNFSDTTFKASEYNNYNFDYLASFDLKNLELEKKYLFDGSNFIESEFGNIYFPQDSNVFLMCSSFFNFFDFDVFSKKPSYKVLDKTVDLNYYNYNFKPILVNLEDKDEL